MMKMRKKEMKEEDKDDKKEDEYKKKEKEHFETLFKKSIYDGCF